MRRDQREEKDEKEEETPVRTQCHQRIRMHTFTHLCASSGAPLRVGVQAIGHRGPRLRFSAGA
jgi:hypothetical protein